MAEADRKPFGATDDLVFVEAEWELHQTYRADAMLGAFLSRLKDKVLLAGRVGATGRVIFPPACLCEVTYNPVTELVPVGRGGVIRAFAVVEMQFPGKPPPPHIVVYVQLDGADTASPGMLQGVADEGTYRTDLVGRRVEAVFVDEPVGDWTDFGFVLI